MSHPAPWSLWEGSGDPVVDGSLAVTDITGANGTPPLIFCGEIPRVSDPRVFLSTHHVCDVVHAAAKALSTAEREQIAKALGILSPAESEEILADNVRLASELAALKENLSVPLAEVIDFFEEREKRRPAETAPVTAPAA